MKKERIVTILICAIVTTIMSALSAYAAASYLYNADEVTYDKTNSELTSTDVQGAIDELYTKATEYTALNNRVTTLETNKTANKLGSCVNLSSYTSSSPYTAPSDGYIVVSMQYSASNYFVGYLMGSSGSTSMEVGVNSSSLANGRMALYIRKGMRFYKSASNGTINLFCFVPLTS